MDTVEESCKVLSISRQCSLLGISRSQHYYQPSFDQEKKDFKLLARIREVLLASILRLPQGLAGDRQKGSPHHGGGGTPCDEEIRGKCDISQQELSQGLQIPQEVSVSAWRQRD